MGLCFQESYGHAGMALGMADAHAGYWGNDVVANLMALLVSDDYVPTKKVHTGWQSYGEDTPKN